MKKNVLRRKIKDIKTPVNNKKASKVYLGIAVVLFLIFSMLSFKSIKQPLQYEEKTTLNNIVQKTNITYSTEALPNGMRSVNGAIFTKVQKYIKVHVTSTVTSEKPVSIKGEGTIYYSLIAEELWDQSTPISKKTKVDLNGSNNTIINSDFQINFRDIKDTIKIVENEITGIGAGKYTLKIKPDFEADILFENKRIPLDNTYELNFEYSNGLVKLIGENKELVKNTPIEEITVIKSSFALLGITLPLVLSRYIFLSISAVLFMLIIISIRSTKLGLSSNTQSISYIDRKYSDRIIRLQQEPNLENKIQLSLSSFKELIQIANDKDLIVLRYDKGNSNIVSYLVIDGESIFRCSINNTDEVTDKAQKNSSLGSDIPND